MNSSNIGTNDNLKRKSSNMYPDLYGGLDKKKGAILDRNLDRNKSKPKFNFTSITNLPANVNLKSTSSEKINNLANGKHPGFAANKPQSNSASHFSTTNTCKNNPTVAYTRNTPNPNVKDLNNLSKTYRSVSLNKLKIPLDNNKIKSNLSSIADSTSRNSPLIPRAISEGPEIQRNKIAKHPYITRSKMLADYWGYGRHLNYLRDQKKNLKSTKIDNEEEINISVEEITGYIKNANNYVSNMYKNYAESFRSSGELSISDNSIGEVSNKLIISEEPDVNQCEINFLKNRKPNNYTEPKNKNYNDSSSKKRLSLPNNFQYSAELNQYYSTDLSESIINEGLDKHCENFQQNVHKFSIDVDEENLGNYYKEKNNYNPQDICNLSQQNTEVMQIINSKIKEKDRDLKYVVENFDFLIENDENKKDDNSKLVQEYANNELLLMKKLTHLENCLRGRDNQNFSLSQSLTELMAELDRGECHRRKLHNYIHELRGNIRAFCRVKPHTSEKDDDMMTQTNSLVRYPELCSNLIGSNKAIPNKTLFSLELLNKEANTSNNSSSIFHFDRVFTEAATQKEIFQEIKPFIQSALDGENVCIFAYGPTGSGKTYTMQGPSWALEEKELSINEFTGILPRSACYIFDELARLNLFNYACKVSISAIEIYNENIFDLFDNSINKQPSQIFMVKNIVQVKNLIWHQIVTKEDVQKFTKEASETRRSDNTKYNENSSRSHAVYQLKLEFLKNNKQIESYINIIDLAGSEKCSLTSCNNKSKEEIETMKKLQNESNFINKSLSSLGRIISMLADKKMSKMAIPYRDSKLTMILQNSLKANSKTAMIVTICSDSGSFQQSKETLKFAANAMMAC